MLKVGKHGRPDQSQRELTVGLKRTLSDSRSELGVRDIIFINIVAFAYSLSSLPSELMLHDHDKVVTVLSLLKYSN